jgi:hypothetical protein
MLFSNLSLTHAVYGHRKYSDFKINHVFDPAPHFYETPSNIELFH